MLRLAEFIVLQPKAGIDARYVQLALHARRFVNFATRDTSGDRPRVDFDKISKFQLPLPPLPEQRRIVARIDELFAEIAEGEAALQRARQGLDTWRRALLKAAVTGELTRDWREANRPTETGADAAIIIRNGRLDTLGPYAIPSGWIWTTIERAGEVLLGTSARATAPQRSAYAALPQGRKCTRRSN